MQTLPRTRFLAAAFMLLAAFAFFTLNVSPAAANIGIDIEKYTVDKVGNEYDADTPDAAPVLEVGDPVMWKYIVTNTGKGTGRELTITVSDDQGVDVVCEVAVLEVNQTAICYGYGTVEAGLYANWGCVEGLDRRGNTISDCDPSHYYGNGGTPTPTPPPPTPTPPPPTPTPPPPGNGTEGCTPGYWKQEHHFDSWVGYNPTDNFDTVFMVTYGGTLAEAADAKGGQENALARHAVAALLNAANADVDYLYSTQDVINMVQAAFASGDYEDTKDLFEAQNEMGCPLN